MTIKQKNAVREFLHARTLAFVKKGRIYDNKYEQLRQAARHSKSPDPHEYWRDQYCDDLNEEVEDLGCKLFRLEMDYGVSPSVCDKLNESLSML